MKKPQELPEDKKKIADFMMSHRGHYVLSMALCIALEQLQRRDPKGSQDVHDVELLLQLFPLYRSMQAVEKDVRAAANAEEGSMPTEKQPELPPHQVLRQNVDECIRRLRPLARELRRQLGDDGAIMGFATVGAQLAWHYSDGDPACWQAASDVAGEKVAREHGPTEPTN